MSNMDELRARLASEVSAATNISEKAEAEGREMDGSEKSALLDHVKAGKEYKAQIEKVEAEREALSNLKSLAGAASGKKDAKPSPEDLGKAFVESNQYRSMMKAFPNGRIPDRAHVQSETFGVKTLLTGASNTSAGIFVDINQTGIYEPYGRRPLTIRSLVSTRTTGSNAVEYVVQNSVSNAAAMVPEATATSGTSGTKPEGGFDFRKESTTVKTLAVWIAATKRALADAGQLRGLINQELRANLKEEEENQILNGNGLGENLKGLTSTSGTQSQAWDTNAFATTRKARTKVRIGGRANPTGYLINPLDWEAIELTMDANERYYGNGPFALTTPHLWGLPIVESEACPEGTAWVGDWSKAIVWDREQAGISVTDSHADFFIRNLIAILCEERLAFGVIRPQAFVEIDLTST